MEDGAYELFTRGRALLEAGDHHAAAVALEGARRLEPDAVSIDEALGRACFGAHRYEDARAAFARVVERAPTDDYALFCLGRALQLLGRHADARGPLTLAASLRPDRGDYRTYRDRARAVAGGGDEESEDDDDA